MNYINQSIHISRSLTLLRTQFMLLGHILLPVNVKLQEDPINITY